MSGFHPQRYLPEGLQRWFERTDQRLDDLERYRAPVVDIPEDDDDDTANSATVTLFLDGVEVATASGAIDVAFSTATLLLGVWENNPAAASDYYYDDVEIDTGTTNLIGNGGFESALAGSGSSTDVSTGNWRAYIQGSSTVARVGSPVHGGSQAGRVSVSAGSSQGSYFLQDVNVRPGMAFDVVAWVRPATAGDQRMGVLFDWDRGFGASVAQAAVVLNASGSSFLAFGLSGAAAPIPVGSWTEVRLRIETFTDPGLGSLSDVDTSTPPTGGETLVYDPTLGKWTPATIDIDDLGNVDTTTTPPVDGQALVWDSAAGAWVPDDVATTAGLATLTLVDTAAPNTLYVNGEEAVYDPVSDRTFYAWSGADRDLYVGQFDHTTGTRSTPVLVGASPTSATDDHGAPSISILADGTLLIAWGTTASGSNIQLSRSDNPRDISAWSTSAVAWSTVYPTLVVLPDGDVLMFAFTPGAVDAWAVARSTDNGATFGSPVEIIDTTGMNAGPIAYAFPHTLTDDGMVHISWTVGQTSTLTRTNLYHAIYDPADGTLHAVDGTDLGTTITSGEHPDCLAYTGDVQSIRHHITADGQVLAVHQVGTTAGSEVGTYTVHVTRWDGSAWSTVDTGAPSVWQYADHDITAYRDGFLGLFCERTGTKTDIVGWVSPDGADWWRAGVLLAGDQGEGYGSVMVPNGDGPILALAEQMPTGYSRDPADGSYPLEAILRPAGLDGTAGTVDVDALIDAHNADPSAHPDLAVTPESVRDAGRWEVVVAGSPAEAVTTEDETDWIYAWTTT